MIKQNAQTMPQTLRSDQVDPNPVASVRLEYGINKLWPTTVMLEQIENKEIIDNVAETIIANFNLQTPPIDGDDYDVLRDGGEILQDFQKLVVEPTFEKYLQEVFGLDLAGCKGHYFRAWLTGPYTGYSIRPHNHSWSCISAVFYFLCNERDVGGELILMDPRVNANRGYEEPMKSLFAEQKFLPNTYDVIMFPSFMYHYTLPFKGTLRVAMTVDFFPGIMSNVINNTL
jgi:hypothetical protein